jgi:hypothetical protein
MSWWDLQLIFSNLTVVVGKVVRRLELQWSIGTVSIIVIMTAISTAQHSKIRRAFVCRKNQIFRRIVGAHA